MDYFGNDDGSEPSLEQINGGKRKRSPIRSRTRSGSPTRRRGRKYARKLPKRSANRYYSRRASRGGKQVFVRRSKYNRAGARKSRHSMGMGSLMKRRSAKKRNYKTWFDIVKPTHLKKFQKRRPASRSRARSKSRSKSRSPPPFSRRLGTRVRKQPSRL